MITDIKIPGFYSYLYMTDKYYILFYKKDQYKYYYDLFYNNIRKKHSKDIEIVNFWIKEKRLREMTDEEKLELL